MQTHTQLPGKKAGWLRVVLTIALLCASLPLVTACNPFGKTTTAAAVPACQTNNTASTRFQNTKATAINFFVDGSLVTTVQPYSYSSYFNVTAGNRYVQMIYTPSNATACTAMFVTYAQCTSYTTWC